ncbi:DUF982 domain-containing protein [Aminobacter sp. BA135]|uniref:DUF982 domain-containing protein n=1 Tax=Aminobacter sp. BA135 TaxID=537596 RepID=UPI003D7B34CD
MGTGACGLHRRRGCELEDEPFDTPVLVQLGAVDEIRSVASTQEAAECLLFRWPRATGPNFVTATEACLAVLQGTKETSDARSAFEEAAREVGILIVSKM